MNFDCRLVKRVRRGNYREAGDEKEIENEGWSMQGQLICACNRGDNKESR